ncbi:hypothetical protein GUJ93_ZPchr0003g16597 [Zizania palustris]|uniref:Uncharacterized protein n=1 Tax=Zizania palustris TaxID=103762 RepID=A0A8J5SHG8_ZIZPA|nr:hypothetical protein GUJ93_ZPchr0003g16597 [Zizania palustris]
MVFVVQARTASHTPTGDLQRRRARPEYLTDRTNVPGQSRVLVPDALLIRDSLFPSVRSGAGQYVGHSLLSDCHRSIACLSIRISICLFLDGHRVGSLPSRQPQIRDIHCALHSKACTYLQAWL